ncbi:hypothetical protein AALA24_09090 [Anaerovoracaceae bacterium 42-11]
MSHISITLLFCLGGLFWLVKSAWRGYKKKKWEEPLQKYVDYFGVFIGIPFFIITLLGFLVSVCA